MGTILASEIIAKAQTVLQDPNAVRWTAAELIGWLNDGLREICAVLPELSSVQGNITLVAGAVQSLPTGGIALFRINRNMGVGGSTPGAAMRLVPLDVLDQVSPNWTAMTAVTALANYMYDPRNPRKFMVYPPSIVNNTVEALYSTSPADITASTAIPIDDIYHNPLVNYVIYRCYDKELDIAGNSNAAAAHYEMFKNIIGGKKQIDQKQMVEDEVRA